ncbi:hypothetical protein [Leucobacter sp. G161]|uniref:hypothetical protein n=1 Tax=Leucobacter sp. G161 TaxID=663704 RepID=UPI00073BD72E|nr:hypothetical protein [Leucobacter sp. G161]KUF08451.1 hypothetical protein AUL38_04670 [Leucobacter sp. G161]
MNSLVKVTRLHLNKPQAMFSAPAQIVGTVMLVTALVSLILQRAEVFGGMGDYLDIMRQNNALVFALPGFLIYYGVQAIATTYPFALALGATRRSYVWGTALANVILSAYVALLLLVLLGLELATDHWFANIYAIDVFVLGNGNPLVLGATAFLLTFVSVSIGGFFGGVWVRFGSKGPLLTALVLAVVLAGLLFLFVPYSQEIIAAVTRPLIAAVALGLALLSLFGTWIVMRRASVR